MHSWQRQQHQLQAELQRWHQLLRPQQHEQLRLLPAAGAPAAAAANLVATAAGAAAPGAVLLLLLPVVVLVSSLPQVRRVPGQHPD